MELTEDQRAAVAEWVAQGDGLSEIQKRLRAEFDVSMTYMDVRFLVIDLGLTLKEAVEPAPESKDDQAGPGDGQDTAEALSDAEGGLHLEVDRVVKPGAVVSGSVTFSDGKQATWMLDQLGRLALDAGDPAYRPSEQDIAEFQTALRDALQRQGF